MSSLNRENAFSYPPGNGFMSHLSVLARPNQISPSSIRLLEYCNTNSRVIGLDGGHLLRGAAIFEGVYDRYSGDVEARVGFIIMGG